MDRASLEEHILKRYSVRPDHPWEKYPDFDVFRHDNNSKWFALTMNVTGEMLGLPGTDEFDIVNLKCDPQLISSLRQQPGFFPAYHMNKEHWISVVLTDDVSDEELLSLVDMSYTATQTKRKKA